jgi:hypothetical protein
VNLTPDAANPRALAGRVRDLPPGDYAIRLDLPDHPDQLADVPADKVLFSVTAADSDEMTDVATNFDLLQALAQESRGKLYTAADVDQLVSRLAARVHVRQLREEVRPWQDAPAVWWLLGAVVGLLTLEWSCRRWLGLP